MAITRTALTDDSGSGTDGTVFNNAWKTELYDQIDAADAAVAALLTPLPTWVAYTPTWVNLTIGNGTVTAKRAIANKIVLVELTVVFGSTTTIALATTFTLPFNNTAPGSVLPLGQLGMYDSSATSVYSGTVYASAATTGVLYTNASPATLVSATVPFTWAVGDQISITLQYQTP